MAILPSIEAMLTSTPWPCAVKCGNAARAPCTQPKKFVFTTPRKTSGGTSSNVPNGRMTHLRRGSRQARGHPLLAMVRRADYAASMPAAARSASTLVLLVRHGVTPTTGRLLPGRRRGLHLSDEGRRQAETLAARLAAVPKIAAIYSSPLERARETVAPLAKARGLAG